MRAQDYFNMHDPVRLDMRDFHSLRREIGLLLYLEADEVSDFIKGQGKFIRRNLIEAMLFRRYLSPREEADFEDIATLILEDIQNHFYMQYGDNRVVNTAEAANCINKALKEVIANLAETLIAVRDEYRPIKEDALKLAI